MRKANDLRQLQAFVEKAAISGEGAGSVIPLSWLQWRRVLERCERHNNTPSEILAFINGIDTRLRGLGSTSRAVLHQAGIRYACLVLSEPSLKHHMQGYSAVCPVLPHYVSIMIIKDLRCALERLRIQDPKRDIKTLLQLVTGDNDPDALSLHQLVPWGRDETVNSPVGTYLSLLVQLGDNTLRHDIWKRFLRCLVSTDRRPGDYHDYHAAYAYAANLLDAGDFPGAQAVLESVSSCAGSDLPGIATYRGLDRLLRVDAVREMIGQLVKEDEHKLLLEAELRRIEKRLGIEWSPEKGLHAGLANGDAVADQPILTMDGDSLGYDSPQRFIAEIQALCRPSSAADFRRIADLLDEHDGNLIPISISSWPDPNAKLYWAPQRSPVELQQNSSLGYHYPQGRSKLELGLFKLIPSKDNSPFASEPPFHMMQLGYLVAERRLPDDKDSNTSPELAEPGYILALERSSNSFLAVFTGKSRGAVNPATVVRSGNAPPGCALIMGLDGFRMKYNLTQFFRFSKYSLELDPGQDLGLQSADL
ncbi:uncharacterized protein BDV14DRAFT_194755 [Aspergillus stella-maris]|uniref:uncharacterized protein n=1 Tax=Aspergillus stella-maris TaxID=1810926 RepID=UPI003CCCEDAC